MNKEVTIIGAGLVGSLLALYLKRRGYDVTVYERRSDMRKGLADAGRSINLALSDRGLLALNEVGVTDQVLPMAIPMHGRHIHNIDGSEAFQPYGKQGQYINSISRSGLNKILMDLAEEAGVQFHFSKKLQHIQFDKKRVMFEGEEPLDYELLFASDGAYSAARLSHMLQHPSFDFHQFYIDCGYKELSIPASKNGTFLLEKNALHIWPRGRFMFIALPNTDGSFTGTLFFPLHGELSFDVLKTPEAVREFFGRTFPDVQAHVPDLEDQFFSNPTSPLVTVKCSPWVRNDSFCLIGDAAHAIVPYFGQGMNAGFEDCRILNELLEAHSDNWAAVLPAFQALRKPDADAIADLAIGNFTEMGAKTAEPKFLLQKKLEARLHELYPTDWIPAYTQVTFSPHIRYSDALQNSRRQEAIMKDVMQSESIETEWESDELAQRIISRLKAES